MIWESGFWFCSLWSYKNEWSLLSNRCITLHVTCFCHYASFHVCVAVLNTIFYYYFIGRVNQLLWISILFKFTISNLSLTTTILPLVWLLIRMVLLVRVYLLKLIYDLRLNKRPAAVILYLPWLVLDVCKVFNLA